MPDGDLLLAWAADPHKRLLAHLLLRDADAGTVLETLTLPAAYCVSYSETFVAGSLTDGAYVCDLTLADPSGFTLTAGGPGAYVPAAAREHGSPAGAASLAAATALSGAAVEQVRRLPRITGRPPFTVKGPAKGRPGLDRQEFKRQLEGQQAGLNKLTVAEFLANRDRYLTQALLTGDGRDPAGNAAQSELRKDALRDKVRELRFQDRSLTNEKAVQQAQQWLDTQAALHDPDQVAGGRADRVTGLGDARVNSSIGAQWPKRIKTIDQQIRAHAAGMTAEEQASTYLDIALPLAA